MSNQKPTFSIGIPAYGRVEEYKELLNSILNMDPLPNEVIVCEDFSSERKELEEVSKAYNTKFHNKNIIFKYIENETNLGYDANIRKLISLSNFEYTILIGNDDLFVNDAIQTLSNFCIKNPTLNVISRSFIRFDNDINVPLGISKILNIDSVIDSKMSPKFIFRSCGFIGGLVVKTSWANNLATNIYDTTLYYQIFLGACAYCETGIGYITTPTVGGRSGNPPLFGLSEKDSDVHVPGSYSAKGRAKMWQGVLTIVQDVEKKYNKNLLKDTKKELDVRQAFHIFEMNVGVKTKELKELKNELEKIGLFTHITPKTFYYINTILGKKAYYFYSFTRKLMQ